jgi:hypothetical protein
VAVAVHQFSGSRVLGVNPFKIPKSALLWPKISH